jgi:hypothetical protein
MNWYVKHNNPKHAEIAAGAEWVYDGPYTSKNRAQIHAFNCEYAAFCEFEIVSEKDILPDGQLEWLEEEE